QPIYWDADRLRDSKPIPVRKFTGALMSFRAEVIRALRFDDKVVGTSAEDADLCARLAPGSPLLVTPAARLFHKRSSPGRSRHHWIRVATEQATYLYRRNWASALVNRVRFAWLTLGYS